MSLHHLIFAVAFCVATFIANAYIYRQFFSVIFPKYKKLSLIICIFLYICNVVFLFSMRASVLPDFIYTLLAILLGFSFFFFLIAIIYDISKTIILKVVKKDNFSENRRRALKLIFDFGFLLIAFSCFFQGVFKAISIPKIRTINLNTNLNKKIVMISDVHLGKNLHKDFLEKLIAKINKQNPDLIVIVGDLIDNDIKEIDYLELLNTFNAPTFYVTGNHEYYHDAASILAELKKTNLNILQNSSFAFNDEVVIHGVNDLRGAKYDDPMDLAKIYKNLDENKFNILLAHQPRVAKEFDLSKFDLVLCGHTHAGQIFPFSILVLMQQGFLHGLYEIGEKTKMYVSSGAGFWGPSIRFLAPSEIAVINI